MNEIKRNDLFNEKIYFFCFQEIHDHFDSNIWIEFSMPGGKKPKKSSMKAVKS